MSARFVTIHGHFYQPPRENPWLDAVEVQDSAAPFHDWNERVTAECYAPNTAARRLDAEGRITDIVNNFEKISFNVGPTLMAWLARHRPEVHAKIVAADRQSVRARGRGNALAQVYNHMIMPLATLHDKITQVRWGIQDFRARFGREPEGMWLPETAVDTETLEVLAEAGLRFTILAPHQAWRVRPRAGGEWVEVGDTIDPRQPYLWQSPRGLQIAVFFYDGPISRAIAFEDALRSGDLLAQRLTGAFTNGHALPQLVHCATDGESYGHHSKFGDMALAAAVAKIEAGGDARLTNYAAYLASQPPTHEVTIRERTSWSCAHGVERWRADCGCRLDPETHQRWRAPLRETLDWLRDQVDPFFEARASGLLKDPWQARDAYVEAIVDSHPEALDRYLAAHAYAPVSAESRVEARRLLEMERHRLLMYTSCGWFFDDIAGLEPVQDLRYAAVAMQHLREAGGPDLEGEFTRRLAAAPGNSTEFRDGAEVYRRQVAPSAIDHQRLTAHYAMRGLFEEQGPDVRLHTYRVVRLDEARESYGETALRVGHVRVTWQATGQVGELVYGVAHFGGQDVVCGVRSYEGAAAYEALRGDLLGRYARRSVPDVVRGIDEHFERNTLAVRDLLLEERRRVLLAVIQAVVTRSEAIMRHVWDESRVLVDYLRDADAPIPEPLAMVARHVLEQDALAELARTPALGAIPERVLELAAEAKAFHFTLDLQGARPALREAVERTLTLVAEGATADRVARAVALIEGADAFAIGFGHWAAQNRFFQLWTARPADREALRPLARALGFAG